MATSNISIADNVFEQSMKFFLITGLEFTQKYIQQQNQIKEIILNKDLSPSDKISQIIDNLLSFSLQNYTESCDFKVENLIPGENFSYHQVNILATTMKQSTQSMKEHSQFNEKISSVIKSNNKDEDKISAIKLLML